MQRGNYIARFGESIFDIALLLYGSVDCFSKLLFENTDQIADVNDDLEGKTLSYELVFKQLNVVPLVLEVGAGSNMSQTYKPTSFQTIFDVALMTNGSLSEIVKLVHLSSLQNINTGIKISDYFLYEKKKTALLEWIDRSGVIFQTKTPIEGNRAGEFNREFDRRSFN